MIKNKTVEQFALSILFICSFGLKPLFASNQNTKFLQGIGKAGYGFLSQDWLVKTEDPLPIFSSVIGYLYQSNTLWLTYIIWAICVFVYVFYSFKIVAFLWPNRSKQQRFLFYFLFFLLHSPVVFEDIYWGFSGQYIINQYLQPSSFAVSYIAAIYYFFKKKYYLAIALFLLPTFFHIIYIIVGSVLVFSCFSYTLFKEKQWNKVLLPLSIYTVICLGFVYVNLGSISGGDTNSLSNQASFIISNYRIPHHTQAKSIFHFDFIIKAVMIIATLYFVKKKEAKWVLKMLCILFFPIVLVTTLINNPTLSLTTPWRYSVVLIPYTILLLVGVISFNIKLPNKSVYLSAIFVLAISFLGLSWTNKEFKRLDLKGKAMLHWVKSNRDLLSQTPQFLVHPKEDYSELFRLETGVPIYVNWKSHPYGNAEVIEWYERIEKANRFYNSEQTKEEVNFIKANGINYFVLLKSESKNFGTIIYEDDEYKIIQVN